MTNTELLPRRHDDGEPLAGQSLTPASDAGVSDGSATDAITACTRGPLRSRPPLLPRELVFRALI